MDKAAITGSFSDYRRVKTRSVMQLIIEVPIEQGMNAVRMLGEPMPGQEIPVAIARLSLQNSQPPAPEQDKPKNYPAAAKLLAKNQNFHHFTNGHRKDEPPAATSNEYMELCIEEHCGVKSCSEIIDGTEAGNKFAQLYAKFKQWEDS